ncbi:uncharacterized protein [Epargyreus clarus]|uniref:uncharacterized protein n=1 Tax=Epargyreus clarus TaxID=520877 RepID=UPI003C2C326F
MLLVIRNLPSNTRYTDVKTLLKEKCGLTELIVDNLVAEGNSKKVTVGLADERDAGLVLRNINGLYIGNQQVYVEDVRQKKTPNQPYQSAPVPANQYDQYQQYAQPQYDQSYFTQQNQNQFNMPQAQVPSFGVPYYMTSQNPNVGNNQQAMVQYPVHQGSGGNVPYQRQNVFQGEHDDGNREQSRSQTQSVDRGRERSSRWNDSDRNRSGDRRGRDRSPHRDYDRYDTDQSYKNNRSQDSFQSGSNQGFAPQQSTRFDKPSDRSAPWGQDRYGDAGFGEPSQSFRSGNHSKVDMLSQMCGVEQYTQSRDSNNGRQNNVSKNKRSFDTSDRNKFSPQNKKFGTNQQYNAKKSSGGQHSKYPLNNQQNKKNDYTNKSTGLQNKPQMQGNWPRMQGNKPQKQQNKSFMQPNRPDFKPNKASQNRPENPKNKQKPPPTPERHEAWRVQASSLIATEILKNVGGKIFSKRDPVVLQLKACVRARLDVILGDDISVGLNSMLEKYREKYDVNEDQVFYKGVMAKVDKAQKEEYKAEQKDNVIKKEVDKPRSEIKPNVEAQEREKPKVNFAQAGSSEPGKSEAPNFISTVQRLPKYPKSSKKLANEMKRAQKEEFINVSLYNLGAVREKALNDELDKVCEVYQRALMNPANEMEQSMCRFMREVAMEDMRRLLTLHIKKRVLNVGTNLSVRVYCQPKPPKRDALDEYLKKFGVISLKKSATKKNMFIATCGTYDNFDALCKQGSTVIDTLTISFKPLQIMGPPKQFEQLKKKMAKIDINTLEQPSDGENSGDDVIYDGDEQNDDIEFVEDVVPDNYDEYDDEGNTFEQDEENTFDNTILNTSDDIIVVEDSNQAKPNDVIVIDGDDKTPDNANNVDDKDKDDDKEAANDNEVVAIDEEKSINVNETDAATNETNKENKNTNETNEENKNNTETIEENKNTKETTEESKNTNETHEESKNTNATNEENTNTNATNEENKNTTETNEGNKNTNEANAENKKTNESNEENKNTNESNEENKNTNETNEENKNTNETNEENKNTNETNEENKNTNETNEKNKNTESTECLTSHNPNIVEDDLEDF